MAVLLSPVGGVAGQFFDNNGDPLVGGKLFTYAAGTTTPQVTFTSALGVTPNSNPIILNGGGRVPAEIWLTDGLQYKFVLYSSTDQLIGSWDNIVGINSNFVNFVTSEEVQTATAGQTVFTLTTMAYQPGTNNLVVYVDGVNQIEGGAYSFVETSSTVVTFTAGLHLGAVVKFVSAETLTGSATSSDLVSYLPAGSGAVPTNVQAKLRETVSVKDFGAVGDGVTDDTAAFNLAVAASNNILVPAGNYYLASDVSGSDSFFTLYGSISGAGSLGSNGMARANDNVLAVGRNWDNLARGLQIGGGDISYGSGGNIFAPDGHLSWTRVQPSVNESSIEFNIYPSASQGIATATSGTNQLLRVSGTNFTSDWIGKKIYFGEAVYKVATVTDVSNLTVTTVAGGAVSFGSTFNETYHVVYVSGSGTCDVSGNTVSRISGDPFVPFFASTSFEFVVDGTVRTVTGFTDVDTYTISASLSLTNVPYTFSFDINDQISTFRLQKLVGGDEENLSFYVRYDGYWMHSLFAGDGKYRKIVIGAGERAPGDLARQLVAQKNGDLSIGGDYEYEAIRVLNQPLNAVNRLETQAAPTGISVSWRSRGNDTNVGMGVDTKGSGNVDFSSKEFAQLNFRVVGSGGTGSFLTITSSSSDAPTLSADGVASDIDITLAPKGTNGRLRIGNLTASADVAITGYIEVKDYSGTIRKLAVIS